MNRNMNERSARRCLASVCFLSLGILISTLMGCQRNSDEPATIPAASTNLESATDAATIKTITEDSPDTAPVATKSVIEVNLASWEEVQEAAASSGKITVVDVWSTVCAPCIKELPGLVELHKELGKQVQCMTVDIDFDGRKSKPPTTYEKDVMTILESIEATFPNYICTTASDDVYAAAEIDSIPAVLVFDAEGKLVKKFVDAGESVGFGYHKDVIPFVESLLKN